MLLYREVTGRFKFKDRHSEMNGFPPIDIHQDYELLEARENGTHTMLKIRRKLDTCDIEDFVLTVL